MLQSSVSGVQQAANAVCLAARTQQLKQESAGTCACHPLMKGLGKVITSVHIQSFQTPISSTTLFYLSLHVCCSHATGTNLGSSQKDILREQFFEASLWAPFTSHIFPWDNEVLMSLKVNFLSPPTILEAFIPMAWL